LLPREKLLSKEGKKHCLGEARNIVCRRQETLFEGGKTLKEQKELLEGGHKNIV
jgi:hypothetical protein